MKIFSITRNVFSMFLLFFKLLIKAYSCFNILAKLQEGSLYPKNFVTLPVQAPGCKTAWKISKIFDDFEDEEKPRQGSAYFVKKLKGILFLIYLKSPFTYIFW